MRMLTRATLLTPIAAALLTPGGVFAQETGDKDKSPLPLPTDRTVAIDMAEGSWISLDVSPDGQTIVFDHLGDLFTIPLTGGDATRLTSGMAFDAQPRFSPNGTRIVFTSDRSGGQNVWTMSLDGSDTTQITKGATNRSESPDWAPDGDYIVSSKGGFRGGGLPKLWLHHVDGGSGVQLIDEPENLKTLGAAFDPSGRYIWYARRTGDWTYNAQFPQYQLAIYDRETGENFTRTSRYGSGVRPTLSPDGRWLVYGTRHDFHTGLRIRDLESGDERWLAYPVQHDDQESRATLDVLPGHVLHPRLAPSGGQLRWEDLEAGRSGGRRRGDPLPGPLRSGARPPRRVRLPHRGHPDLHRPPDPRRGAVTRRLADRVHGAGSPLGRRRGRHRPQPSHRCGTLRALSGLVPRGRLDRLRHLGRRGGPPAQGSRGRARFAGAADGARGGLYHTGLVPRG